ncbi:hypothetical protein [Yersinia alsatica]|uniref:hypothetical protein n=1 Tax=Yersinia alsatica TaxID=2890317 RepID=UPI0011A7C14E|nr:hypothetical protein [Yersinia alsatica]
MINVQLSDDGTEITSYFSAAQDPIVYPHIDLLELSDPRWIVFYESVDALSRKYLPAPIYL